ncbi:MAG TPA: hypothetical protein VEP50_17505 [bacterium]|nr:hypothetical protein [bacterium]
MEKRSTSTNRTTRRLVISGTLVSIALIVRVVLIRAGGRLGGTAEWLPIAVIAGTLGWSALSVTRNFPGAWGRPIPRISIAHMRPSRAVALNGMLAGLAVLLTLMGSRMPEVGWAIYWLGALPIMVGVNLHRRWGILGYLGAALLVGELLAPLQGLTFALFTGMLGLVSGLAATYGRSWAATWILCAVVEMPALAFLLIVVPGLHLFWFRPNPHTVDGVVYVIAAAATLGLSWVMTAMLLYRPIVRAIRQRLIVVTA